jgi:hypothetical protein
MRAGRLLAGGGGLFLLLLGGSGRSTPVAGARLPDMVATLPQALTVKRSGGRQFRPGFRLSSENIARVTGEGGHFQLGFRSAGENIGAGPLVLEGVRAGGSAVMSVEQLITRADGSIERHPVPAVMHYDNSGGHSHWHYKGFMVYELRDAYGANLVRPAHKTGFCLGDRYEVKMKSILWNAPDQAIYTGHCGLTPG